MDTVVMIESILFINNNYFYFLGFLNFFEKKLLKYLEIKIKTIIFVVEKETNLLITKNKDYVQEQN
jgi:hypothetical protein